MPEVIKKERDMRAGRAVEIKPRRRSGNVNLFAQPYRHYIASLTCCSKNLRDLIDSFPAILFALTTDYGTAEQRAECVRLINEGAPLRCATDALGLPWWLRKIPAGGLRQPFGDLPDTDLFGRQIVNLIPKTDTEIRYWLRRVVYAYQACDVEYALWMARHKRFPFRDRASDPHVMLAAWAWFSKHPHTRGHQLLRMGWSPEMSMAKAYDEARAWEHRLRLAISLGNGLRDSWFEGGEAGGYDFVPLTTVDDFLSESRIMGNCLDQYGDQVTREHARVFSMRVAGKHVADLEIGFHEDDPAMPVIEQLRGPKNKRAGAELWQAAYKWLGSQTFRPMKEGIRGGREIGKKIKMSIWKPYLDSLQIEDHRLHVEEYAFHAPKNPGGRLREILRRGIEAG